MGYLVSDLMQETRRSLYGMNRAELNSVKSIIATTDITINLGQPVMGIGYGSYLAVDDEIMYCWSTNPTAQTAIVQRGMLGTTPAQHNPGVLIEVNPRYANYAIRYALREEIRSWGPQVYGVKSFEIQTTIDVRGYDLQQLVTDNFYNILSVRHSTPNATNAPNVESWPRIQNWQIFRNAPTSDFPSGCGLIIPEPFVTNEVYDAQGGYELTYTTGLPTLNVVYAVPFNVDAQDSNSVVFGDLLDVLGTVGLDETMIDIPPIGAAWRLLSQKEALRTELNAQGQPVDLQFHPPLYASKAAAALKQLRDSRLSDAQVWLLNRYGLENWGI